VELVDLSRLEVELVEREHKRVGTDAARSVHSVEEVANVLAREDPDCLAFSPCVPPGSDAAICLTRPSPAIGR
jgi:hypothetical protein